MLAFKNAQSTSESTTFKKTEGTNIFQNVHMIVIERDDASLIDADGFNAGTDGEAGYILSEMLNLFLIDEFVGCGGRCSTEIWASESK